MHAQSLDGDKEGVPSINNSVVFKHFRFGESGDPDLLLYFPVLIKVERHLSPGHRVHFTRIVLSFRAIN